MRILLTGAGGPSTEAILKLWSPKHELFFTDAKIDSITPQVSSDKRFFVLYATDKQFLQAIIDLTTRLQIDILISQVDEELPILAGIFVIENLSEILQVSYFKYTRKKYGEGRRIFKMSPIHHHYQKSGYHESKIVVRFWIVGILLAVFTIVTLKLR